MPKVFGTVRVTAIQSEYGRYHVESWSKAGETHLVDLCARYPLGRCSCMDYQGRRWPEFKTTLKPVRCRHLTAAREAMLNSLIRLNGGTTFSADGE